MNEKAVFWCKDGNLVESLAYDIDPQAIWLADGAIEGLKLLHDAGFKLFVVSNQSSIAHGLFTEADLDLMQQRISAFLTEAGVPLAGFYFCPHHPEGRVAEYTKECFCRKPRPGMLFQAAREHNLNLANSWMVGDILDDVEAGHRAGVHTVLLDNGTETQWIQTPLRTPHRKVKTLLEAARAILEDEQHFDAMVSADVNPLAAAAQTPAPVQVVRRNTINVTAAARTAARNAVRAAARSASTVARRQK
jgi:D,D-heptose 1,7-bisphosphate phosphatase